MRDKEEGTMNRIAELLDQIKEHQGIETDYALAKLFGLRQARIGEYYKGIAKPDDYLITRVALMLHMEPVHRDPINECKKRIRCPGKSRKARKKRGLSAQPGAPRWVGRPEPLGLGLQNTGLLSGGTVRGPFAALLMTGDTGEPIRFAGGTPGEDQHTGKHG